MNTVIQNYIEKKRKSIETMEDIVKKARDVLKSTDWTSEELMIEAMKAIWHMEDKLKKATETYERIVKTLGEA